MDSSKSGRLQMVQRSAAVHATRKEENGRRQKVSWIQGIQGAMAEKGSQGHQMGREKL